jgi:hypothetical protein
MQETLHNHNSSDADESIDDVEAIENGTNEVDKEKTVQNNENFFMNWPLMSSIIAYCVFSLHDIAYQEVKLLINDTKISFIKYMVFGH